MAGRPPDFRRYLNIRAASGPSFSSDGRRLSFLTNITGVPQVWAVDPAGGWPDQLTFFPDRVSAAEFAPVGDSLVFSMDSGGDERHQLYLVSSDGADLRPLTEAPQAIHIIGGWSRDGRRVAFAANRRSAADFDVYVQEALAADPAGAAARLVYQGAGVNNPVAWSPDGRALVVAHVNSLMDCDLYLVGVGEPAGNGALAEASELAGGDRGTETVRHLTPHEGEAQYSSAAFAADGKGLYLISDRGRDTLAPAYLDLVSLELRYLEDSGWDAELLALSPDGRRLAVSTNVDGYSALAIHDLTTGELARPSVPEGVILDLKWSPNGERLAFTLSGPTRNADVWTYALSEVAASRVTLSSRAGLAESSFVAPRLVRYATFDGREIPALYYEPREGPLGNPPPVVVSVHGGPEGQERPSFNPIYQYFLSRGYAVFAPNVRGSTGYGKAYSHLDDVRLRMDSVRDLEQGWRWLVANGADPRRVAVMGGSYGGFMVLAAVTTYPDLWAAAIDIVGIANFVTFLENTGPWRRKLREVEYGSLEADADFLREISPIHHVDRIRAPLLVIHGANDPRVPIGEAEQIVEEIRRRDGIVEYLRFEDEGHGLVRLPNRVAAYTRIGEFFDRHLAGSTQRTVSGR
jgi:dipeptidyl aminopeptidase/acylaminoacyl peptidase